MVQFLYYIKKKDRKKERKRRRRRVMIITRTRTGFRTERKMKQNYTAMYTTCGIICKSYAHINYF